MSISQLLQPNNYHLHCASITTTDGVDSKQNIAIQNFGEVALPDNTVTFSIYQLGVTGTSTSTYRVEYSLNVFASIQPSGLITIEIMRGFIAIGSYNLASISGTVGLYQQLPLHLVAYDTPGDPSPIYSLKVTTLATGGTSYLAKTSTGLSSTVIITEVFPISPISLNIAPSSVSREETRPPDYVEPQTSTMKPIVFRSEKKTAFSS